MNLDGEGFVMEVGLLPKWGSRRPIKLWNSCCCLASAAGSTQQVTGNGHYQEYQYHRQ